MVWQVALNRGIFSCSIKTLQHQCSRRNIHVTKLVSSLSTMQLFILSTTTTVVEVSVSTGWDKKILVPVSLCPGTRAGEKIRGQNVLKNFKKKDQISCFKD